MTKPKRERSPCVSCNVKHRCGKQDKKYCGTLQNHTIRRLKRKAREMRRAMRLPEITVDQAEELAKNTDYYMAVEDVGHKFDELEISVPDAGAFFNEGYEYAKKQLRKVGAK